MWAEKRPHEWLGGVLGVLGLAPSARNSHTNQKVLKRYIALKNVPIRRTYVTTLKVNLKLFISVKFH